VKNKIYYIFSTEKALVRYISKHISSFYLFALFAGTLFFIPSIFVNRFTTAPALWVQVGIGIGIAVYVLSAKRRIPLPPKGYAFLMTVWAIYHLWKNQGNIENTITIITLISGFFVFYTICSHLKDKGVIFVLFTFLALGLSLWTLGQSTGLLPSYHGSFVVTGPFDNPAGISASLALLLPFALYGCLQRKQRVIAIIGVCLIVTVIILSRARAAVLAIVIIFIYFFIRLLRERNIKLLPLHYTALSLSCLLLLVGLLVVKKDSASGRLFIWQCSTKLISLKPISGYGGNGFTANYMNEQSTYFARFPDSKYANLADNVRHPFNEFLKWTVNYGIIGIGLTLLLVIIPLWISRKEDSQELFFIRLSLLSIGICAFFSYPLNYPFIRIMVMFILAYTLASNPQKRITSRIGYLTKGIVLMFSLGLLSATSFQAFYEREWHKTAHKSLRGETAQMLPRYKSLYAHLHHKDLFLYNYAAELNVAEHYEESQQIALECESVWADYDLQMLMADNCMQLKQYSTTEVYLEKATAMCPVKFMPLYQLSELYQETGRKEEARVLAKKILDKKVKIPSPVINSIKNKIQKIIENER